MSQEEEAVNKKRPRDEGEEDGDDDAAAASSEPPLKQTKADEDSAAAAATTETPTQSNEKIQDEKVTTDSDVNEIKQEGQLSKEQSEPNEENKKEATEPESQKADSGYDVEALPAQGKDAKQPQDTSLAQEQELDKEQESSASQDNRQQEAEMSGAKTEPESSDSPPKAPQVEVEATEVKTESPPRPTDPVAEQAAGAAAAQVQAEVKAEAPTTGVAEVVAGITATPATQQASMVPPLAAKSQQQGIETSPDKLAPPPEAVPDLDQVVEEKGEISAVIAGRVIGKGGEVIRDLQARSGASIDVDAAPSGTHRIVTYRGPRRKVDFAKQLVDMISRGMSDADLPLGEATRQVLTIPSSATGKVIGRGGEMVREMQTRSQAKIDFDHAATANRPDQKQIIVTGTYDAVRKANEMIMFLVANPQLEAMQALNLLVNEKLASGQPWGSGPPYPSLPNAGSNMQPEMLGSYGSPGGYGPDAQYATAPPGHSSYGRPPDPRFGGGGNTGMGEDVFYAKKQFMGRIIGQRGITINDLQKRSGADIQINQDVPPGAECEIRIRGTRDGIEMVKHMLRQIIEIGPGHPYAGGGGAPGGPGGHYGGGGYGGAPQQGVGGYDYGGQSYGGGYPSQQQSQGGYGGYPPQGPTGGSYGGGPPGGALYQNYGGYPGQDYGGTGGVSYGAAAPAPYGGGGGGPQGYSAGGGYQSHVSSYQSGYSQQGGYPPQQSSGPPPQQGYGGAGAYGQAPPSYPPAPAASSGWKAASSPDGQTYYYNESTGATQWDKPPGFA